MASKKTIDLEESFTEIEKLLEELERDDIGIEEAFDKYCKGVQLLKQCDQSIDKVEKKVLKLMEDGKTETFADMEKNTGFIE